MPSDTRTTDVLDLLAPGIAAYHSAVATTSEAVRRFLDEQRQTTNSYRTQLAAEFGSFGEAHLDTERLAAWFGRGPTVGKEAIDLVQAALARLTVIQREERDLFAVRVEPDGSLNDAVAGGLARIGRAYGAARAVQAVKRNETKLGPHMRATEWFPFAGWNTSERRLAPPLVVEVGGNDVKAAGLTEFLDGGQKIVLVVDGRCSPAPLARLISRGVFVVQAETPATLETFAAWSGPGVAALVTGDAALFSHDPDAGRASWERITIDRLPELGARRKVTAGLSAAQQTEDLELLAAKARPPEVPEVEPVAVGASEPDPVDQLAAWLLDQANVPDPQ